MKVVVFILACWVLVLSSVPCSDGTEKIISSHTEAHSDDGEHSEHSEDGCNPFCICTCCGIHISFEVPLVEVREMYFTNIAHSNYYENLFVQGYTSSVWHPPAID